MPEKFQNKYKIQSARLPNYNYAQNGMYFVTICTKDKEEFFGQIKNGKMILNGMGEIVQEELLRTPIIRPYVFLDKWIIMPNHLHIILEIINQSNNVETPRNSVETPRRGVSTMGNGGYNIFWKPHSLGSIINQFKSVCTKRIWKSGSHTFAWQPRFHDHIIRNEMALNKIREYVINNPKMWEKNQNNMGDLWV